MAILNNALLGELSGQIGNLVVYKVNGKTIIRKKPEWKQAYRPSKLQKFNQLAFKEVQQFLLPLKDVLDFGFGEYLTGMKKGIHLAMSWAMKHAVIGEENQVLLQKTKVRTSRGDLPLPVLINLVRETDQILKISWDSAGSLGTGRETDFTWVLFYHPTERKVLEIREASHRSAEIQRVPVSGIFKDPGVLVFLSFYRKNSGSGFRFSDSVCFELE